MTIFLCTLYYSYLGAKIIHFIELLYEIATFFNFIHVSDAWNRLEFGLRMKENGVRMKEIGLRMARERRRMMGDLSCGKWGVNGSNCYYTRAQILPLRVAKILSRTWQLWQMTVSYSEGEDFWKNYCITPYLYIIYILYINMSKIWRISKNFPSCKILLSFVTIVTFCHELTARIFGNHENNEYLCNSKIKQ